MEILGVDDSAFHEDRHCGTVLTDMAIPRPLRFLPPDHPSPHQVARPAEETSLVGPRWFPAALRR
jgi:hypothetical protein